MAERVQFEMTNKTSNNGPLLQLIATGLKFWLKNQLDEVHDLTLELNGSALELIKGHLNGISITAKKIKYQGFEFDFAKLKAGPLKIKINLNKLNDSISLEQSFQVNGTVAMNGNALSQTLQSTRWSWLGDMLFENLLGQSKFGALDINDDILELNDLSLDNQVSKKETFILNANSGSILISHKNLPIRTLIPMDKDIYIEKAYLQKGMVHITGHALVQP